jgi:sugar lactone lactonase YvrE
MPTDSPRTLHATLFHQASCRLAEGLFWFQDQIWWIDIEGGRLHSIRDDGQQPQTYDLGQRIGSCAPITAEKFIVALEEGIGIWSRESGAIAMLARPEAGLPDNRFNDGKCDPRGRFLAGTLNMKDKEKSAALYALDHDGSHRTLLSPLSLSNGLAWSQNGRTLYHIDTPTREVSAFEYDAETGTLGAKTTVVRIPKEWGFPDGMDIDHDGNLWIAHWDGWAVRCYSPVTGQCLAEVRVPCQRVSCCRFGGPNHDRLYITTAREGLTAEQLTEQPLAGSLFVADTGTHGFPISTCSLSASLWKDL